MKERKKIFTRDNFEVGILVTFFLVSIIALTPNVNADEIKFGFKNPSFSGIGTGAQGEPGRNPSLMPLQRRKKKRQSNGRS